MQRQSDRGGGRGQAEQHFPFMALCEQRFDDQEISEPKRAVNRAISELKLAGKIEPGQSVAVAVGSRGIHQLERIVFCLCRELEGMGLKPFIVPAMGSHGGATAKGQEEVLASLGITEERIRVPVRSSLETVHLGDTRAGISVFMDALACQAEHTVVVNRIKAHTKFKAEIESGLVKMLAIGLGKHQGASTVHGLAVDLSMPEVIRQTAGCVLEKGNLLFGLGIIENGYGRTYQIAGLRPEEFLSREPELLALAKELAPKIPFAELDLLIVDRIGKDISGTGMDTNVTGRNRDILGDFSTTPRIKRVAVRDLSPGTGGNGLGIGLADFCTQRVVDRIDLQKTYTNALTAISPEKASLPMHFQNDREMIRAALGSVGSKPLRKLRVVRILDTLHLDRIQVSHNLPGELPLTCSRLTEPEEMEFTSQGDLMENW
ncbi:MAG: lactate racemase domain-containing protein [Desulfohalobiaceae bacterium]|nr:lactate racemase domain-containing protein [Desulfohalobiaceae bacterium]